MKLSNLLLLLVFSISMNLFAQNTIQEEIIALLGDFMVDGSPLDLTLSNEIDLTEGISNKYDIELDSFIYSFSIFEAEMPFQEVLIRERLVEYFRDLLEDYQIYLSYHKGGFNLIKFEGHYDEVYYLVDLYLDQGTEVELKIKTIIGFDNADSMTFPVYFEFESDDQKEYLRNSSFDGETMQGTIGVSMPNPWEDCGSIEHSPPDIHGHLTKFFNIGPIRPSDGNTFLGMVSREHDGSVESLSQRLRIPLSADKCYFFSVDLCASSTYASHTKDNSKKINFDTPIRFRIYGSEYLCDEEFLIYESPLIDHNEWKRYWQIFQPEIPYEYVAIKAYVGEFEKVNGHILIDNMSDFWETSCHPIKKNVVVRRYK